MKIDVNGTTIYYEEYNEGDPIIFLHGNGESGRIFRKIVSYFPNNKIYLVDSRHQGKSKKVKEITYDLMVNDTYEFITKLNIQKPIIVGFSDGGIIGLMIAMKYPDLLSRLVSCGASLNPNSTTPGWVRLFKFIYFITRKKLFKLMLTEPNIDPDELKQITIPTLILAGSKDMIKEKDTRLIAENISNSKLKIIDNESHMSYVLDNKKLYELIRDFVA